MPYKYLENFKKNGAKFFNFTQHGLAEEWKQNIKHEHFTGACVGMNLCFIESLLVSNFSVKDLLNDKTFLMPDKCEKSINLQLAYEREHKIFIARFFRDLLRNKQNINFAFPEERNALSAEDILESLPALDQNRFLLLDLKWVFHPHPTLSQLKGSYSQEHMVSFIKFNNMYMCFDPNNGIAIFPNILMLQAWLNKEMIDGGLVYLAHNVQTKIILASNRVKNHGEEHEGLLEFKHASILDFPIQSYTLSNTSPHFSNLSQSKDRIQHISETPIKIPKSNL